MHAQVYTCTLQIIKPEPIYIIVHVLQYFLSIKIIRTSWALYYIIAPVCGYPDGRSSHPRTVIMTKVFFKTWSNIY